MYHFHVAVCWTIHWTVSFHCVQSFSTEGLADVEHIIQKRQLREAGFTHFHVAKLQWSHEQDGVTKRVNTDYIRRKRDVALSTVLHLDADTQKFNLNLKQAPSAIHRNTIVELRQGTSTRRWDGDIPDCFLVGHLHGNEWMTASFSYCSRLMGSFSDGLHDYWVEGVDVVANNQSMDNLTEHVILCVSDVISPMADENQDTSTKSNIYKPLNPFQADDTSEHTDRHRYARATYPMVTIEAVFISDALNTQYMNDLGFSDEQKIEMLAIKANGAQAEWSRADVLGYDVRIDIKLVELWTSDAAYYTVSNEIGQILKAICQGSMENGEYLNFDHIFLISGATVSQYVGLAYIGKMCHKQYKCSVVVKTSFWDFTTMAHELGHNMGMKHDSEVGCSAPDIGLMGSKLYGWSSCSVNSMHEFLNGSSAGCLSQMNVSTEDPNSIIEKSEWPGMRLTADDICGLLVGPGYRFREYPYTIAGYGLCGYHSCMNMDVTSPRYGTSENFAKQVSGVHCGVGKVCLAQLESGVYPCKTWAETGLDVSLFVQVPGGWSEWGSQTTCSRTCGTGVYYRQRRCDNPKPVNCPWCEGEEYDAQLCNTDSCPDDELSVSDIIKQRAGETCTHVKANNLYPADQDPANYLNTGNKFNGKRHGQCEVKCDVVSGFSRPIYQRDGLIPDGTPCTADALTTFIETNGLVRMSGMYSKCLQGYCQLFGCDDVSGTTQIDRCGVCGGGGEGCQEISGIFTTNLTADARADVVELPLGAFRFQSYFIRSDMKTYWLELWSNTSTAIIAFNIPGPSRKFNTVSNPVSHAGALWYYHYHKQFLYAVGNMTENVVIKLFNTDGTKANEGVYYAYSIPVSTTTTTTVATTSRSSTTPTSTTTGIVVTTTTAPKGSGSSAFVPASTVTAICSWVPLVLWTSWWR